MGFVATSLARFTNGWIACTGEVPLVLAFLKYAPMLVCILLWMLVARYFCRSTFLRLRQSSKSKRTVVSGLLTRGFESKGQDLLRSVGSYDLHFHRSDFIDLSK